MVKIVTNEEVKNQKYDYIVVGTGVASFSLIQNLKYKKILCIEAGDLKNAAPSKYISNQIGHIDDWKEHSILGFGGTSHTWSNHILVAPLVKTETLNWPIKNSEFDLINSYASKWLKLDPVFINNLVNLSEHKFISRPLISKTFPINFFSIKTLSSDIDLLVNSRVKELIGSPETNKIIIYSENDKNIQEITLKKPCKIILAAGGFENARILINSKPLKSYNHSSMAGKFLMEHPHGYCGHIFVKKKLAKIFSSEIGSNQQYQISAGLNLNLPKNESLHCTFIFFKKKLNEMKKIKDIDDKLIKFISQNSEYELYSVFAVGEALTSEINKVQLLERKKKTNSFYLDVCYFYSQKELQSIYESFRVLLNELIDKDIGFGHFNNDFFKKVTGGGI